MVLSVSDVQVACGRLSWVVAGLLTQPRKIVSLVSCRTATPVGLVQPTGAIRRLLLSTLFL